MLDGDFEFTNLVIADTFDGNTHLFYLVKREEKYYLKYERDERLITRLIIKPDAWVYFKDGGYEHGTRLLRPCLKGDTKALVKNFTIDPNIFDILIGNNLVSYSKAMADLYHLPAKFSRDYQYHHRDYKHSKNKNKVLKKMQQGNFN